LALGDVGGKIKGPFPKQGGGQQTGKKRMELKEGRERERGMTFRKIPSRKAADSFSKRGGGTAGHEGV